MRALSTFFAGFFLLKTMAVFAAAATPPPKPVALPDEVTKALQQQAAALKPGITIIWTQHWDPPLKPAEYASATGTKNVDRSVTYVEDDKIRASWQSDGKYLITFRTFFQRGDSDKSVLHGSDRDSFDGTTLYRHTANAGEPHSLTRMDIANANDGDYLAIEYFSMVGLPLPLSKHDLETHAPLQPAILELLNAADTRLSVVEPWTVNGQKVIRIGFDRGPKSPSVDGDLVDMYPHQGSEFFFLDPGRNYLQIRRETFDKDGNLKFQTDCSDFRPVPGRDILLPYTVVTEGYQDMDRPKQRKKKTTITVNRVELNPVREEEFALTDSSPGTWVIDHFGAGKQVIRVIQKDGTLKVREN